MVLYIDCPSDTTYIRTYYADTSYANDHYITDETVTEACIPPPTYSLEIINELPSTDSFYSLYNQDLASKNLVTFPITLTKTSKFTVYLYFSYH